MKKTKLIVLLLALVILLSAFFPVLGVSAVAFSEVNNDTEKETIKYVSLGDSMTNGLGLDGYDSTGHNGYLEVAPDSYPAQFAEWLKGETGKDVNLTQLATSAARAEDIYYMLTRGTEYEFEPDYWTKHELLQNPRRWGHPYGGWGNDSDFHADQNDIVAATFQTAVKEADIISLSMGDANYGVFLMGRILNIVGLGDNQQLAIEREVYSYMTLDNALALLEPYYTILKEKANIDVEAFILDAYNTGYQFSENNDLPTDMLAEMANYFAYTTASFMLTYAKTVDLIIEMNPDVELIIVPIINNLDNYIIDFVDDGNIIRINIGDMLDLVYEQLDAYMAAYPAVMQYIGEYENATILYAELPTDEDYESIKVEMFDKALEELYVPVPENARVETYPANRLFCHNRFIDDIRSFIFPILFGSKGTDFNEHDVMEYEIALSRGSDVFTQYVINNSNKAEWIAYYLGVVDSIFTAMNNIPVIDLDELAHTSSSNFNLFDFIGPYIMDMSDKVINNISCKIQNNVEEYYYIIVDLFIRPQLEQAMGFSVDLNTAVLLLETEPSLYQYRQQVYESAISIAMVSVVPDALDEELNNVDVISALLAVYGRLKLAYGLACHPSATGHDTITDSLVNAYKQKYTVQDETIDNFIVFIRQYYDVIYELLYNYADEQGYIDMVVESIDLAIDYVYIAIEEVSKNLPEEATEELQASLIVEFYAIIDTLNEIREVLVTDSAADFNGLLVAIKNLEDDYYRHCNNIAEIYLQIEHINQGHTFTNYVYNNDATCTTNGTESAKCDTCSKVYTREALDTATGHSFTNYVYNNDATCTEDGTETATCDYCDAIDTKVCCSSSYGHDWKDATCTNPKTCERCGEVSGNALGHCYDNDCDAACNACGKERTPSAHIDDDKDGVCDKCGIELDNNQSDPESTSQKQNFFVVIWTHIVNFFKFLLGFIFKR